MGNRLTGLVLLVAVTAMSLPACADSAEAPLPPLPFAAELQTTLDGVIDGAIADGAVEADNPLGFTLTVMVPGYAPWTGVAGESEPGVPVTTDMAFCAGSTTKSFVAALVLQLAEEGILSLDDQLGEWLPDYRNVDSTATIRQLLNHTSGTFQPNHHPDFWPTVFGEEFPQWTDADVLSYLLEPYSAKGTEWHYSNAGYILLGQIIEKATGLSVGTELRARFFEPLGLRTAFFHPEEVAAGVVAEGWYDIGVHGVDSGPDLEPFSAHPWTATMPDAGGIFANSEDMATWAQALWGDRTVLSPESMDEMLDFVAPEPDDERSALIAGYGLGAIRFNPSIFDEPVLMIGHSGGALFYSAVAAHLPDYGVTIGAALNSEHDIFGLLLSEVMSVVSSNVERMA